MGRLGSCNPTLPLRMALATADTASSWPMTLLWSMDSSFRRRSLSFSASFFNGIFVHIATTSAISFSPTTYLRSLWFLSKRCFSLSYFFISTSWFRFNSPAWENASIRIERSICTSIFAICSASSFILSGICIVLRRNAAAASSIRSMALSGRFLSLI